MKYSPFHRQLDDIGCKIFSRYESKFLNVESLDDANDVIKSLRQEELELPLWLESLHSDIVDKCKSRKDTEQSDMFFDYFLDVEMAYYTTIPSIDGPDKLDRLQGLIDDNFDVNKPHFEWIRLIDDQVTELLINRPDISEQRAVGCAWNGVGFELNIDVDKFIELIEFKNSKGHHGLTINQFVHWYERSAENFNGDRPSIDLAKQMAPELLSLTKNGQLDPKIIKSLCQDFKIHPSFRVSIEKWADAFMNISHKDESEMAGPE